MINRLTISPSLMSVQCAVHELFSEKSLKISRDMP